MIVFSYYLKLKLDQMLIPLYKAGVLSDSFVRHGEIFESYLNLLSEGTDNKKAIKMAAEFFDISIPTMYRIKRIFSAKLLQE